MSEGCDTSGNASEGAKNRAMGVHFQDLVEIIDPYEKQDGEKEGMDFDDQEEIRRRLRQAESRYRETREIQDKLFEHGLAIEELINELEEENKDLTCKLKKLQLQVANVRKRWKEEEEEEEEALPLEPLFKEEIIYTWKDEEEEEDEDKEDEEDEEEEEEDKDKEDEDKEDEEEEEEDKDKEDEDKEDEDEDKEDEDKEDEDEDKDKEDEDKEDEDKDEQDEDEEHEDERLQKTESWCCRTKGLWKGVKVGGAIALCVLLPLGIMTSMMPMCNCSDPNYNLWNIAFNLLEPFSELHHTHPPVF